jgi:tRNA 5-methylaminomethyl-2-thiouridine biosynthesis bifunctional protein
VQGATLHAQAADEALVWALTAAGFVCRLAGDGGEIAAVYRSRRPQPARAGAGAAGIVIGAAGRLVGRAPPVRARLAGHADRAPRAAGAGGVRQPGRHLHAAAVQGRQHPDAPEPRRLPVRAARMARLGGVGRAFEGADCGVLQLARDERHAGVQQEVLATWNYPQEYARWADAQEASA